MASQTDLWTVVHQVWHIGVAGLALLLSIIASGHAVLYKRDSRAAIAWVGFVWLVPLVGAVLYLIFGINRLRRQALLLRSDLERYRAHSREAECPPEELHRHLPPHSGHLEMLARVVGEVVAKPLLAGNRVEPLLNGDETYPAMLDAIRNAKQTVSFLTYIFDRDEIGLEFAKAFGEATRRGVEVRVLIDAAGTRYSMPTILRALRREKVRYARFLPAFALWRMMSMNLRTHRKILVADGRLGFTGGLNIRAGHCLQKKPRKPVQDIHFRVEGPVVAQLQEVFAEDWCFTTKEALRGEGWFPQLDKSRSGSRPRRHRRTRRGFRKAALDIDGRAFHCAPISADCNAVFFAGSFHNLGLEPCRDARRRSGHRVAVQKQSVLCALGFAGDVVAITGTWLPHLANTSAVRSFEIDDRRWLLGLARVRQLGSTQFAPQFRIQRRMLRCRTSPTIGETHRNKNRRRPSSDTSGS